jgi:hypothetical protein
MNNIKKVAKYVASRPETREAKALLELAIALETNAPYKLSALYDLDHDEFRLALGLIDDWRLDRHYLSRLHLLDHAGAHLSPAPSVTSSAGASAAQ